jgi:molybdopterin-binding protein
MRTSARSHRPGTVRSVTEGQVMAKVVVAVIRSTEDKRAIDD